MELNSKKRMLIGLVGPKGDPGEKGDKGDRGEKGKDADISIFNKISTIENALIQSGTIDKRNGILTEELQQTGGNNLSGLTIIDGSYATVNKINGNTVAPKNLFDFQELEENGKVTGSTNGLKNAQISGIKSTGRNLIPYPYQNKGTVLSFPQTVKGLTFTNDNGTITVNGTAKEYVYFRIATLPVLPDIQYSLSGCPSGGSNSSYRLNVTFYNDDAQLSGYDVNDRGDGYSSKAPKKANNVVIAIDIKKGVTVSNFVFNPMFNRGDIKPYEPYTESIMQLPQTVELGKWDYIENGQIVRQTIIEQFDSTKYDEENGTYNGTTNFVLSDTQVAYKGAQTIIPLPFDNQYLVWDKGIEQVLTPKDESGKTCFDYGANTTVENEYMILLGGAE